VELVAAPWRDADGQIGVLVLIHDPAPPPVPRDAGAVAGFGGLIGSDPAMLTIYKLVDAVAPCRVPVLIEGEPGTGKERVAQLLHARSGREERPLMLVECAGLNSNALELELFGRAAERGLSRSTLFGRAELAHGGTLVLHHITEMAPALQERVLRLIESGTVERVGDATAQPVDVRLAATTERPLESEVRQGRFREDLAHHLRTIHLQLPPLRDRMGDLLGLIEHFLDRHGPGQYAVDSRAMAALYAHSWPGNVGELERVLEHAIAAQPAGGADDPRVITVDALPAEVQRQADRLPAPSGFVRREEDRRTRILRALAAHGGNRSAAARALGIGRATFYRWWGEAGLA
jgi:two-component system NtrC family response regulator